LWLIAISGHTSDYVPGVLLRIAVIILSILFVALLLHLKRLRRLPLPGPVGILDAASSNLPLLTSCLGSALLYS
jgi:hypothetical protein